MSDLAVYTDSVGYPPSNTITLTNVSVAGSVPYLLTSLEPGPRYQPADTTFTVTNIRFPDGAGRNGLLDGDSSGLQTINGDPVADATDPDTIVCGVAGGSVFAVQMVSASTATRPIDPNIITRQAIFHSDGANPDDPVKPGDFSGWKPSTPPALQLPG